MSAAWPARPSFGGPQRAAAALTAAIIQPSLLYCGVMTKRATGTFTSTLEPLTGDAEWLGRLRVAKTFEGDLVGAGRAEMLSVGTAVEGSAGYVAIDLITGSLDGREGTFVLQHSGLMARGTPTLTVTVVPDSGTGDLAGLTGTFEIGADHSYVLTYDL